MPPSWRDEYAQSLRARDEREKASYSIIDDDIINACKPSSHTAAAYD
jgi:hypothetical protein